VARPVSVMINTYGTGRIEPDRIAEIVNEVFDFRPARIIKHLNLLSPIYKQTAAYGHFGRETEGFTWEKSDMADEIKNRAGV